MADDNEDQEQAPPPVATEAAPVPNNAPATGGMVLGGPLGVTMPSHTYGDTTTTPRVTDDYKRAAEAQGQAYQNEASAVQQDTDAKVLAAQGQADIYSQHLAQDQEYLRQRQIADAAATQRIEDKRRQAESDDRLARIAANPTSYWDDRTAGERTQARIGVWLGVLGGALGQSDHNVALDYLNKQIDKDTQNKAARAERLFKLAEHSTGALSDAYRQRAEDLGDKDAQRTVGWDIVAKQIQAATMASQVPEARAQGAQLLAQVQEKKETARAALQDKLTSTNVHEDKRTEAVTAASQPVQLKDTRGNEMGPVTPHAAPKLQQQIVGTDKLLDALHKAQAIEKSGVLARAIPAGLPFTDIGDQRVKAAAEVNDAWRALDPSGVRLTEKTRGLMGELTGAEGSAHVKDRSALLEATERAVKEDLRKNLAVQGVRTQPQFGTPKSPAPRQPQVRMSDADMARTARDRLRVNPNDKTAIDALDYLEKKAAANGTR